MADSDFRERFLIFSCYFTLVSSVLHPGAVHGSPRFRPYLYKLAWAFAPGGASSLASLVSSSLDVLSAALPIASTDHNCIPFGVIAIHLLVLARLFRCLRFVIFVTSDNARLAMW